MNNNQLAIPVSIVIAGALIAGALYMSNTKNTATAQQVNNGTDAQELIPVPEVTEKDWIKGNPNAEMKIVEYSDPECPFCRMFDATMQKIIGEYGQGGKVAWVYRHMPLSMLHQKAYDESVAMQCAGMLGGTTAFWIFADELYAKTPSNDGLDHALLPQFAAKAGIDAKKFADCRAGEEAKKVVDAHLAEAEQLGIQGTPHSFILYKGEQVSIDGAQPYEAVKRIIDTLLKK